MINQVARDVVGRNFLDVADWGHHGILMWSLFQKIGQREYEKGNLKV